MDTNIGVKFRVFFIKHMQNNFLKVIAGMALKLKMLILNNDIKLYVDIKIRFNKPKISWDSHIPTPNVFQLM